MSETDGRADSRKGEWLAVAKLLRPQGRRGEILAEPLTDVPGVLVAGASLRLTKAGVDEPAAQDPAVALETLWHPTGKNAGRVVLKLRGYDDISAAELLAARQLMIAAEALPPLEADNFYVRDLLGCALWDSEALVGEIVDVQFATTPDGRQRLEEAAPLLEVQPQGAGPGDTVLVPFVRVYLVGVDVDAKRVDMRLPPGLVDLTGVESAGEA